MINKKLNIKAIPLKCYTIKELRQFYGVPERTFTEWLKSLRAELQMGKSKYLTAKQVKMIFEAFGVPGEIIVD